MCIICIIIDNINSSKLDCEEIKLKYYKYSLMYVCEFSFRYDYVYVCNTIDNIYNLGHILHTTFMLVYTTCSICRLIFYFLTKHNN